MRKIGYEITTNPATVLTIGLLLIAAMALLIEYTMLSGVKSGTISGKVISISQNALGGGRNSVHRVDIARVRTSDGQLIQVRCESYCRLDQNINVTIYSPLFSENVRYIYKLP